MIMPLYILKDEMIGVFKMVKVGNNQGIFNVNSNNEDKPNVSSQSQNKLNCIFDVKNDKGQVVEKKILNAEGKVSEHYTYEYNEEGQVIKMTKDYDGGGVDGKEPDGKPDDVYTYKYDKNGQLVRETKDYWSPDGLIPDGNPDEIVEHKYDRKGQLVETSWNYNDDEKGLKGGADEIITYEYNEKGQLVKENWDGLGFGKNDKKPDGKPDEVRTYEYNNDQIVRETRDYRNLKGENNKLDGIPDEIYEYPSSDLVEDNLNTNDVRVAYKYDKEGRVIEEAVDKKDSRGHSDGRSEERRVGTECGL